MHLQGMPVQNHMVLYRKKNYEIRCGKGKLMLCLFMSMSFCQYIQIITIISVSVNIFFCVLIKVLTNLKHFQSMPHSHAILCWIYIVLLSSSDV